MPNAGNHSPNNTCGHRSCSNGNHSLTGPLGNISPNTEGPFLINAANHDLIGVANVFLDALFYDVKLDYYVAIINQQGEVSGNIAQCAKFSLGKFSIYVS